MEMEDSNNTILVDFKARQNSGAFLCRHRNCPRAAQGFSTSELRQKHEESHSPRFQCAHASCGFLGTTFNTRAAMKRHATQYHDEDDTSPIPDSLTQKLCDSHEDRSLFNLGEIKKKRRAQEVSPRIVAQSNYAIEVGSVDDFIYQQASGPPKGTFAISNVSRPASHPYTKPGTTLPPASTFYTPMSTTLPPMNEASYLAQSSEAALPSTLFELSYAPKGVLDALRAAWPGVLTEPYSKYGNSPSSQQLRILEIPSDSSISSPVVTTGGDMYPYMPSLVNSDTDLTEIEDFKLFPGEIDMTQPVAEQSFLSPSEKQSEETVAPSKRTAFSNLLRVADFERSNAYTTSPVTDARSPFREDSQFAQDGVTHSPPTKFSYQQAPGEDARAYGAEANVQAQHQQHQSYRHDARILRSILR